MSRPLKGLDHVDGLEGDETGKARLRAILETLAGASSVEEACETLSISPSRFHLLRARALSGALDALAPAPPGRPATPPPDPTIEALRQENADLRTELEVSRLRTEIALAMPHVVQAPRRGQKGGSTPKPDGRRST